MILAAVYIKQHEFLFDNKSQILNFGGNYFYDVEFKEITNEIIIYRKENEKYFDNFYNSNIKLISGIVGANGTGKTTILKIINKGYREDTPAIFIYENFSKNKVECLIDNRIGLRDENGFIVENTKPRVVFDEDIKFDTFNNHTLTELHYSPIYDKSINPFYSLLNIPAKKSEKTLEDIYNENLLKDVLFLNSNVSEKIKTIYRDFPYYSSVLIKPKKLYKRDFTKVYIDSNLGNPNKGETLRHTIERDLRVQNFKNPKYLLSEYLSILNDNNITDALKELWNLPKYKNNNEQNSHLLHNSKNLIKDIEINILSFLLINDPFPKTNLSGTFDFNKILKAKTFESMLDLFLAKYIVQTDRDFIENIDDIKIEESEKLILRCRNHYHRYPVIYGENTEMTSKKIIFDIEGFKSIKDFYDLIKKNKNSIGEHDGDSSLELNFKGTHELLRKIIQTYTKVKKYFSVIPISTIDFIDIEADKNLSYGEKSLLNLYSTLYDFTLEIDHTRESENYLLILDEADLGYHPLWKRKYIDAINETLPEIFNTLQPRIFDDTKKKKVYSNQDAPNIQIIFTTHDPLTLSDLPNNNVVYLKKEGDFTKVLSLDDLKRPTKTFGANVSDLLSDSFFVNDGLIGDFAKKRIENLINILNQLTERKNNKEIIQISEEVQTLIWKAISIIDEPIIRNKLIEMFDSVFNISINNEIQELEERLKYLKRFNNIRND